MRIKLSIYAQETVQAALGAMTGSALSLVLTHSYGHRALSELPTQGATEKNSPLHFPTNSKRINHESSYTTNGIQNGAIKHCVHAHIFHMEFTALSVSVLSSTPPLTIFH